MEPHLHSHNVSRIPSLQDWNSLKHARMTVLFLTSPSSLPWTKTAIWLSVTLIGCLSETQVLPHSHWLCTVLHKVCTIRVTSPKQCMRQSQLPRMTGPWKLLSKLLRTVKTVQLMTMNGNNPPRQARQWSKPHKFCGCKKIVLIKWSKNYWIYI